MTLRNVLAVLIGALVLLISSYAFISALLVALISWRPGYLHHPPLLWVTPIYALGVMVGTAVAWRIARGIMQPNTLTKLHLLRRVRNSE